MPGTPGVPGVPAAPASPLGPVGPVSPIAPRSRALAVFDSLAGVTAPLRSWAVPTLLRGTVIAAYVPPARAANSVTSATAWADRIESRGPACRVARRKTVSMGSQTLDQPQSCPPVSFQGHARHARRRRPAALL